MSKGFIIRKLINEENNEWEEVNVKDISKGDRIQMYLSREDAASNNLYSDAIVESEPFIIIVI